MRGILINSTTHTGNDLGLVMTAKQLPPPTVQTYTVSVPGRNGLLDLSEFLTGEPTYSNRTLKFEFLGDGSRETVLSLIDFMLSYHGKYITVTLDDFSEWYYTGRATVDYKDTGAYATFTLTIDTQPFSYALTPKTYTYTGITGESITLFNRGVSVTPTVTVDAETVIIKGDVTLNLTAGTYDLEDLKLVNGNNTLTITTEGTITISYREAVI